MIMLPTIEIVGTWEEILQQSNTFVGKRVKLTLLDDNSLVSEFLLPHPTLLKQPLSTDR
jgi:hypothetical protein